MPAGEARSYRKGVNPEGVAMRSWKTAVIVVGMACGVGVSTLVGQSNPNPTGDDQAVANGAPKAAATPAIWKVKGAHGTVYLFGTIHVGARKLYPLSPAVEKALMAWDKMPSLAALKKLPQNK